MMENAGNWEFQTRLKRWVDGDTADLTVDLGFSIFFDIRVRLYGINAPELYTTEGKATRTALARQVPEGSLLKLISLKDKKDKYGRYLAVLFTPEGLNINEWLVDNGLASRALY